MPKTKWKKYEGGDSFALVTWLFRREPYNVMVHDSGKTLEDVLALIPEHLCEEEDEVTVVHVGEWIIDEGGEALPRPGHITSIYTVSYRNDVPEEADEESAA